MGDTYAAEEFAVELGELGLIKRFKDMSCALFLAMDTFNLVEGVPWVIIRVDEPKYLKEVRLKLVRTGRFHDCSLEVDTVDGNVHRFPFNYVHDCMVDAFYSNH